MGKFFRLPFIDNEDTSSLKDFNVIQFIVVIGSGILSSSVLATALKTWLENRKTRVTIQIDGDTRRLEYEGHYLQQDASTIQTMVETLVEEERGEKAMSTVTIDLSPEEEAAQQYLLQSAGRQDITVDRDSQQDTAVQPAPLLSRLLKALSFFGRHES